MSKLRGGCIRRRGLRAAAIVAAMAILTPSTKIEAAGGQPTIGPSAPQGNASPMPSQPTVSPPGGGGSGSGQQMSDAELRMRIELLKRSMGFGGIFGPALRGWANQPAVPNLGGGGGSGGSGSAYGAPSHQQCARYTDNAAIQACKAGDMWAADRLQQKRSTGSERDWYNR